jgi:hypothetical protein
VLTVPDNSWIKHWSVGRLQVVTDDNKLNFPDKHYLGALSSQICAHHPLASHVYLGASDETPSLLQATHNVAEMPDYVYK